MATPLRKKEAASSAGPLFGFLKPSGKREALALKALDEERLPDAAKHIAALAAAPPESAAWKLYLQAWLKLKSRDPSEAEAAFLQSSSLALIWAFGEQPADMATPYRLAAMAWECAGMVRRRGERGAEAVAAHLAGYRLRMEHGTTEEQWQSALSLGISYLMAKDQRNAVQWLCRALDFASRCREAPEEKLAMAYAQLASASRDLGDLEEAILAGRKSLEHWRNHDISAASVAEAEYRLGELLVAQAERSAAGAPPAAAAHLHEAIHCMRSASLSLEAFGHAHERMARVCRDRLEFAERLAASLASD